MAGTFYWVVYPSSGTDPANSSTGADFIIAGQDGAGVTATASGSVADTGQASPVDAASAATGLTAGTAYDVAWTWKDGATYATSPYVVVGSFTTAAVYSVDLSEAGSASDSQAAAAIFARTVAETASAGDSQAAAGALAAAAAEAASATDAASAQAVMVAVLSESGSADDELSATAAGYDVSVTEAASAADAVTVIATMVAAVSEALSAADALTVTAVYGAALSEGASAADSTNWAGTAYSVDLAETATLQDAVAAALQALEAMAESGNATDVPTVIISAGAAVAETGAAADFLASALQMTALLTEQAAAVDAVTLQADGTIDADIEEATAALDEYVAVLIDGFLVITAAPRRTLTAGASRPANLSAAHRPHNLPGRGR